MPPRELLDAYQQGQISRRTFIRRLVASGVSLAAAVTYADVLWGGAPAVADTFDDFYCPGEETGQPANFHIQVVNGFDPGSLDVFHGGCVRWHFATMHGVIDPLGILNSGIRGDAPTHDSYSRRFPSSGTFNYSCPHDPSVHPTLQGSVHVPLFIDPRKVRVGKRVWIAWSLIPAPAGFVFDIEVQRPPEEGGRRPRKWERWKKGTTAPFARFRAKDEGTYRFRARLRRADGVASGWTRPASVRARD